MTDAGLIKLTEIVIQDLMACIDLLEDKPFEVAFTIGAAVSSLEIVKHTLKKNENMGNERHAN